MSDFLWVEKYRPKKISECILTQDLKETFTNFIKQKEKGVLPITDDRMTRFNITLDEGVDFVLSKAGIR